MTKRWYIVHAHSNFEKKVAEAIKERAATAGLGHLFDEVLVPMEEVAEVRRGRKVSAERKFFPGYVLVKMEMTDQAYHLIKNTPKVTNFIGNQKPTPVPDHEIASLLNQIEVGATKPTQIIRFEEGDEVQVIDGAFSGFSGVVDVVKPEKQKVIVLVSIFGRATPVELEFTQVEKSG